MAVSDAGCGWRQGFHGRPIGWLWGGYVGVVMAVPDVGCIWERREFMAVPIPFGMGMGFRGTHGSLRLWLWGWRGGGLNGSTSRWLWGERYWFTLQSKKLVVRGRRAV